MLLRYIYIYDICYISYVIFYILCYIIDIICYIYMLYIMISIQLPWAILDHLESSRRIQEIQERIKDNPLLIQEIHERNPRNPLESKTWIRIQDLGFESKTWIRNPSLGLKSKIGASGNVQAITQRLSKHLCTRTAAIPGPVPSATAYTKSRPRQQL